MVELGVLGFRRLLGLFCGFFMDEKIEVKRGEGSCRKFGFLGKV